jgi:hypothetical protein
MSSHYLRFIPEDPRFVPTSEEEELALSRLRAFMPRDKVTAERFGLIRFVDQGENFERILCPHCRAEISSADWGKWLDRAAAASPPGSRARYASGFADLTGPTPCCGRASDLNSLVYECPAGFASFMLEVENPHNRDFVDGFLADEAAASIAEALGCPVRQILSHY